jgi:hypothetical protein
MIIAPPQQVELPGDLRQKRVARRPERNV